MARFGVDNEDVGSLRIDDTEKEERIRLYFVPKDGERDQSAREREGKNEKLLAEVELELGILKIYPICTLKNRKSFLRSKYQQIHTFVLNVDLDYIPDGRSEDEWSNWLYEQLPRGFVKDFHYGMGLLKGLKGLINVIEENTRCSELVFVAEAGFEVDGSQLIIGFDRFDEIRSEIDRIADRGRKATSRVKDAYVHNALAEELGLSRKQYSLGRHPHSLLIAKAADGIEELSDSEQGLLVDAVIRQSSRIVEAMPGKLEQLRRDVELVTLDRLISNYADALDKQDKEGFWQQFFEENTFALQQIFGVPMLQVSSSATVGGTDITGRNGKIADYLLKHSLTNNIALVEIKKPTTPLLEKKAYRGGIFAPSRELVGAVSQILDQAYHVTKDFVMLKDNSRLRDLESYAVRCFVVAGRTPASDNPDMQKSFELYRANCHNVTIVTYDEVLAQMKILRDFLSSAAPPDVPNPKDES